MKMKYLHRLKARCFIIVIGGLLFGSLFAQETTQTLHIDSLNHALENTRYTGDSLKILHEMAFAYQAAGRNEEALAVFEKGILRMDSTSAAMSFKMSYISGMLVSLLQLDKLEKVEPLLNEYESILRQQESQALPESEKKTFERHKKLLHTLYADWYIHKGCMDKAGKYLHEAELEDDGQFGPFVGCIYYKTLASYQMKSGNYQAALSSIDKALQATGNVALMQVKVEILRHLNRETEALALYKEMLKLNTATSSKAFDTQMSQLRKLNDLDGQEERAHELARQAEQIALQQRRLVASVSFTLISILLIYVLILYYQRVRRLKNELFTEKNALVESEKQLRLMTEQAEAANLMKTAFISNISHEIRTPLNVIVGFSELLLDDNYDEDAKKSFAQTISANTERLLKQVNDVLDLSRLESGKIQFSIKPVDMIACCRESFDNIKDLVSPNIQLTFSSDLTSYTVHTDRYRIQQLLSNLLSNSIKFTQEGEINLSVKIDESQCQVRLIVTDTGCGIKPEQREKIFDYFEKIDEFAEGTGLGLPICKIIAQRLSGSLFVDPDYTGGARFVFVHPLNLE